MVRSHIRGIGSYVPPKVVTNDDLSKIIDTTDEWIKTRSGIEERHYAEEGVACSDLGQWAAERAIEDAGIRKEDVDFIIFATLSPDHHFPGAACYMQPKLGVNNVPCLDVRNQCSGFLYSLSMADAFVRAGVYKNVLVVGAEVHSSGLDFSDAGRDVTVLFGDGAGAAIVSPTEDANRGILYTELHADGRFARSLRCDVFDIARKPFVQPQFISDRTVWPYMEGKTVFKHAVTRLTEVIVHTLEETGTDKADIKYVIPHQANMRINHFVAEMLEIPKEKVLHNIQRYGNTTAASIPLLLDETYRAGKIEKGDLLLITGFGAGFTWGSILMRW
ncbi:MAG: beta-ketoacyl-ACP synthase III [Thermodesulfobacteriota bacterium]